MYLSLFCRLSSSWSKILSETIEDALEYHFLPGHNYDKASRIIPGGGNALVVAWGHNPNTFKKGHIDIGLNTNMFSFRISDLQSRTSCVPKAGFKVGLLEQSYHQQWIKAVIFIN